MHCVLYITCGRLRVTTPCILYLLIFSSNFSIHPGLYLADLMMHTTASPVGCHIDHFPRHHSAATPTEEGDSFVSVADWLLFPQI